MAKSEAKENFIISLFDWRIKKLLALQYFKVLYLFILIFTSLIVVIAEFYIARFLDFSVWIKLLLGVLAILGGLLSILFARITYEFYFAFFYIESHLRDINRKS